MGRVWGALGRLTDWVIEKTDEDPIVFIPVALAMIAIAAIPMALAMVIWSVFGWWLSVLLVPAVVAIWLVLDEMWSEISKGSKRDDQNHD